MFEIINETNKIIEEAEYLEEYVNYLLKKLDIENAIFDIIFVDKTRIRELNKQYRNVDNYTDVISFALEDNDNLVNQSIRMLGDIFISIDVAYEQALLYNHSRIREVCFLATHGLLHLLGYDHLTEKEEKIMFEKQKELLESYDIYR